MCGISGYIGKKVINSEVINKTLALIGNGYECIVDNVHTEPKEHKLNDY